MKKIVIASLIGLAALSSVPAAQAANVGVSISVGQPGFFGQIDLGNAPPPQLLYPQPVIYGPVIAGAPPIYLHVPLGYERDWRHHCYEYRACGRPVYFVRDDWYRTVYVPHYRDHYYGGGWHNDVHRAEVRRDEVRREEVRHEERRDDRRDDHRGRDHDRDH